MTNPKLSPGPFYTSQLKSGDPYELSQGHAIYAAPTGHDGAGANLRGGLVLDTDPMAPAVGVDAGIAIDARTMRAPDLAVGLGPERPGWGTTIPPLAVEYASVGQDEGELQQKITDLLGAGTRWIWVVRLLGPRRVEVYESGRAMKVVGQGESLLAPGVLQNPVLVEALYDREVAHEATLRNLLQRRGYESLDEVRAEGVAQGVAQGLRPLEHQFERRLGRALAAAERASLAARIGTLGADRLGDVVLDLDPPVLAAWLGDPDAR